MTMKRSSRGALALVAAAGGLLGWSVAGVIERASTLSVDPAHYRVWNAVTLLRSLPRSGPAWGGMGVASFGGAWIALRALARTPLGWPAAASAATPLLAGALMLHAADPSTQAGRFLLVGATGVAVAGSLVGTLVALLWPVWVEGSPRVRTGTIVTLSLAVPAIAGAWMGLVQEPTGDEPSYLLAMHSLVVDQDLDVGNNHARQDYRFFYPTTIEHGQLLPTRRGIWLPKHSLGLPILCAPAYALGGVHAVRLVCSLLVGALALSLYLLVRRHDETTALRCWCVALLTAPLTAYAGQIYPNVTTGLLLVGATLGVPRHSILAGVALGLVPWFHLGTWPLAIGTLVPLVWKRLSAAWGTTTAAGILWGALVAFHLWYWGSPLPPRSPYGTFALAQIPGALPGLFLDQESGLLWLSPAWVLALGSLLDLRTRRPQKALFAGWLLYVSSFNWWFGGWSPTGRFLLPSLGLLTVLLSDGLVRVRHLGRALWLWGCAGSVVLVAFPFFRFNAHDGTSAMLDALGAFGQAAARLLPSVVAPRLGVWLAWVVAWTFLGIIPWCTARRPS